MKLGAIFDMDGLLFDTEPVYNKEWYKVAQRYKVNICDEMLDELRGTSGEVMYHIVNKYCPEINAKMITDEVFENARRALLQNITIKKGALELLSFLKSHHVKMAVASSSPMEMIINNLKKSKFEFFFDEIVSGQEVLRGKPFPDIFLLAAKKLNLKASDCYVFEDGIHGVQSGVDAGCVTIMVPDLVPPTQEHYKISAGIYKSLYEVLEKIKYGKL